MACILGGSPSVAATVRKALEDLGAVVTPNYLLSREPAQTDANNSPDFMMLICETVPCDLSMIRQARACSPAKIAVLGPTIPSKDVLEIIRAGADDYVESSRDLQGELQSVIERFVECKRSTRTAGRVAAITSANGGCGTSTLAVNLAVAMTELAESCLLIDLGAELGDLDTLLRLSPRHTLADLADRAGTLDEAMLDQALMTHHTGVRLLAAGELARLDSEIVWQLIGDVMHLARRRFEHTFVDVRATPASWRQFPIAAVDTLLLLMRPDFPSIVRTLRWLEYWSAIEIDAGKIRIVARRTGHNISIPSSKISDILGRPISHEIPEDLDVLMAANLGQPVICESRKSPFAKSVTGLAQCLSGLPAITESKSRWKNLAAHSLAPLKRVWPAVNCT